MLKNIFFAEKKYALYFYYEISIYLSSDMNSIHILLSTPHDNFTMLLLIILLKGVSFRIIFFYLRKIA